MKYSKIEIIPSTTNFTNYNSIKSVYKGSSLDRPIGSLACLMMLPIFVFNTIAALVMNKHILILTRNVDALGRPVLIRKFSVGIFRSSACLYGVIKGDIGICGVSQSHTVKLKTQFNILNQIKVKPGIFSLYDLHLKTGLSVECEESLLVKQLNGTIVDFISLLVKSSICAVFYGKRTFKLLDRRVLPLFGLNIKNTTMKESVDWVTNQTDAEYKTKIGFFVNVNSVNLSISNSKFHESLSKADALFADGSGMRIAAKNAGFNLAGNNNGTDMLPHLCKQTIKAGQSIFLLGAEPSVAEKAAKNLLVSFPGLSIAGTQHGFSKNHDDVVKKINASNCDVLLVAMGSPTQEDWIIENQLKLNCKTALAVGGLFDFYSGNISRSPLWMRELGLEWIWRLIQEPKVKFNRYVIGTPLFLYRTFILGLANSEIK